MFFTTNTAVEYIFIPFLYLETPLSNKKILTVLPPHGLKFESAR